MTNGAYGAHSLPPIKGLGSLTVKELTRFETASTVFKTVNQLCPDYMAQMFQRQREQAKRTLRNTETDLKLSFLEQTMDKSHLHTQKRPFGIV